MAVEQEVGQREEVVMMAVDLNMELRQNWRMESNTGENSRRAT